MYTIIQVHILGGVTVASAANNSTTELVLEVEVGVVGVSVVGVGGGERVSTSNEMEFLTVVV